LGLALCRAHFVQLCGCAAVQLCCTKVPDGAHAARSRRAGEQVIGLAAHAAARVMGLAGEDQVLVSGDVAEELRGSVPLRDEGSRELRGVPGEWRLFKVASAS
jgi:class 3 adenylate cyclase